MAKYSLSEIVTFAAALLAFIGATWANINSMRALSTASRLKSAELQNQHYQQLKFDLAELVSLVFERSLIAAQFSLTSLKIEGIRTSFDKTNLVSLRQQLKEQANSLVQKLSRIIVLVEKLKLSLDETIHARAIEELNNIRQSESNSSEKLVSELARRILDLEKSKLINLMK